MSLGVVDIVTLPVPVVIVAIVLAPVPVYVVSDDA